MTPKNLREEPILASHQALADRIRREYREVTAHLTTQTAESWERKACRACQAEGLVEVLSLGDMPPANALLRPSELNQPEPRFPLSLRLCQRCGMVQLGHVVPAELLFRSYLFLTSSSRHMSEHFSLLMTDAAREFVHPGGLIVEIGSNDGTALSSIQRRDVRVLGVDPARNIAVMAAARGVPTISEFFTEVLASEIVRMAGRAQLIVGCNVLGHIDDLDDVCRGIQFLLAPDGAFVFEVPYLGEFVDKAEYDTIYHEHLSYFAVRPLVRLLNRHGLQLKVIEFFPVHGGTIRCTVVHGSHCSPQVEQWLANEEKKGLNDRRVFDDMARKVEQERVGLRKKLVELRAAGKKIIGYGAPAKGAVVLNYCNIDTDLLPFVVDVTPVKQGWHMPGTHQPILPPSVIQQQMPDYILLLAWNHGREIKDREAAFCARGGRFITPRLEEI